MEQIVHPSGAYCALVTPMNDDESVNLDELQRQVERQMAAGMGGLFLLGTNGEFCALSCDEKQMVMQSVMAAVRRRVPVVINVGDVSSRETRRLAHKAVDAGADFVAMITPWFIRCSQAQLARHYRVLADDLPVPVVMYNIPARTGNRLEPCTIEELADHPNIVALKDSSGDPEHLRRCADAVGNREDFSLLVGTDSLILAGLEMGCAGAVSGLANVVPEWCAGLYGAYGRQAMDEAEKLQNSICELRGIFEFGDGPAMTKLALAQLFPGVGHSREPAKIHERGVIRQVHAVLRSLSLLR